MVIFTVLKMLANCNKILLKIAVYTLFGKARSNLGKKFFMPPRAEGVVQNLHFQVFIFVINLLFQHRDSQISLTMYPFSISTDEHVPPKCLIAKSFILINQRYI